MFLSSFPKPHACAWLVSSSSRHGIAKTLVPIEIKVTCSNMCLASEKMTYNVWIL